MSEIKALEDMRNTVKTIAADCDEGWILGCLDAIEGEIAERFMELPVDTDGVPIHVGDYLQLEDTHGEVIALTYQGNSNLHWMWQCDTGDWYFTVFAHHTKPRTLEDVLIEYRLKAYNLYADQELTGEERVNEFKKLDAEYDSDIRELLGVGE